MMRARRAHKRSPLSKTHPAPPSASPLYRAHSIAVTPRPEPELGRTSELPVIPVGVKHEANIWSSGIDQSRPRCLGTDLGELAYRREQNQMVLGTGLGSTGPGTLQGFFRNLILPKNIISQQNLNRTIRGKVGSGL